MPKESAPAAENSGAAPAQPAAAPQPSFAERKAAQLKAERVDARLDARKPRQEPALEREPPVDPLESDEEDDADPLDGDDESEQDEALDPDEDELPLSDDDDSEDPVVLRKRLVDTQKKLREVTANRQAMDREQVEIMSTHVALKHDLQDTFTEARQFANAYVNGFTQQIQQLETAFTNGMIPPDQLPQARQQHQMFCQQRHAIQQQIERLNSAAAELKTRERERQAEVARIRLSRSIPDWSRAKHRELGEYAQSRGYTPEEFSENLDYRFLELLHDSMQLNRAGDALKRVQHQRKPKAPQRNASTQTRSADGRFRQAEQAFRSNPGERGRFAEMKARQLARERRGR